ncbi:MAG: ComF family protein [Dehalococcoidia bacterium]|nr:MAG: ComF family protein [Dehalococcoidia bacterium]
MSDEFTGLLGRLRVEAAEFVLPQRCLVCGRFGAALHPECAASLPAADGPRCHRCWRPGAGTWCERCASGGPAVPAFDGLRTPFTFTGDARRAILEAKFRGVTALLVPLARAAADVVPGEWAIEAVVPVPLARGRRRSRGYNQAEVAAAEVAGCLGVPVQKRWLRRTRETPPQASLTADARSRNLRGAFEVRLPDSAPRRVLVVDDVTTTGATLEEAARAFRAAGARQVYALAIARED